MTEHTKARNERYGRWIKEREGNPARTQDRAFIEFHESLSALTRTLDAFAYPDFHEEVANTLIGRGGEITITIRVVPKQLDDGSGLNLDWDWGGKANDLHRDVLALLHDLYGEGAGLRADAQSSLGDRIR